MSWRKRLELEELQMQTVFSMRHLQSAGAAWGGGGWARKAAGNLLQS